MYFVPFAFRMLTDGLDLARICLIFAFGIIIYRHLRLPSVPWLLSSMGIRYVGSMMTSWFIPRIMGPGTNQPLHNPPPAAAHSIAAYSQWIGSVSLCYIFVSVLFCIMLLSEMAHFATTSCPQVQSKLLARLQQLRTHMKPMGIVLVILSAFIYLISAGFSFWFRVIFQIR